MADQPNQGADIPEILQKPKRRLNLGITLCGIASTVVTFVVVEMIRSAGTDPMLFYLDYVIPGGAILVGLVAGMGYAVGSWLTQTRLSRGALLFMMALHAVAWALLYVTAWWRFIASDPDAQGIGFFTWFDVMTRSIQFTSHGHTDAMLGGMGYLIRLGEVVGFVLGGVIAPGILFAKPYCDPCQRYLKHHDLFQVQASAEKLRFVRQVTQDVADAPHKARMEIEAKRLHDAIASGNGEQVATVVASLAPLTAANKKVADWLKISRHRCPGCGIGFIDLNLTSDNAQKARRLEHTAVAGGMLDAIEGAAARLPGLRTTKA